MILFGKELPDFPGRNPDLNPDEGEEHSVSITVTRDQIESLRKSFGIDVEAMVEDALIHQTYYEIGKMISKACFDKVEVEIESYELEKLLLKSTKRGNGFIILNVLLATIVQEYSDFEAYLRKSFESAMGTLYPLGILKDYKILVDPNLRFDDPKIAVITDNFYNFRPTSDIALVMEGTSAPKTVTKVMMNMKKPKTKVFKVNNIQI